MPGAYKGCGKGNAFLNDLVDADALVHVVDASCETDATGAAVRADDAGEDALAFEIGWVREEVHRWIAGNVARKWHSVSRLAKHRRRDGGTAALDRLLSLFNGYHCTNAVARRAVRLAGLDDRLSALEAWGPDELHRLVAAFLEVRFPTVVALNKCDRPSAKARVAKLLESAPNLDVVPMAASIESALVALRARGAVAYVDGAPYFERRPTPTPSADADLDLDLDAARRYLAEWRTTGTLDAISKCVAKARPRYAYPVSDLDAFRGVLPGHTKDAVLPDCLVLRDDATVEDVYVALGKRGLSGDFVRADTVTADATKRRQAKLRDPIAPDCRVLKVATNKKAPWQHQARRDAAQSGP